jgi:hypothetical protein
MRKQHEVDVKMTGMPKKYTVPEKSLLRQIGRGFWVGSTFMDHGKMMRIVAIGPPYRDGQENLIDVQAEETPRTDQLQPKTWK